MGRDESTRDDPIVWLRLESTEILCNRHHKVADYANAMFDLSAAYTQVAMNWNELRYVRKKSE